MSNAGYMPEDEQVCAYVGWLRLDLDLDKHQTILDEAWGFGTNEEVILMGLNANHMSLGAVFDFVVVFIRHRLGTVLSGAAHSSLYLK